jgi:hypothetical protein
VPGLSVLIGVILAGVGLVSYFGAGAGWFEAPQSGTALIPAYFGAALIVCGLIVFVNDKARKHAMHVAAMIALFGAIGGPMQPVKKLAKGETPDVTSAAFVAQMTMTVLCVVFVVAAVRSFIAARRARQAGGAAA